MQYLDPEAPALCAPAQQPSSPAPLADGGAQPVLQRHWPDGGKRYSTCCFTALRFMHQPNICLVVFRRT